MTPESYGLLAALTFAALLLAALGALLLFEGARGDDGPSPLVLTDGRVRVGDGSSVLRFRLEAGPAGRTAFRAAMGRQDGAAGGGGWPG
jgi:hypothetical protein